MDADLKQFLEGMERRLREYIDERANILARIYRRAHS